MNFRSSTYRYNTCYLLSSYSHAKLTKVSADCNIMLRNSDRAELIQMKFTKPNDFQGLAV